MNRTLALLPFAGFLFILPFPGTVAFRLLCLAAVFLMAVFAWRRFAPPPLPARAAIVLWALVAGASVLYSFDPAYSLGELKNEVGYALMAYVAFFTFVRGPREHGVLLAALGLAVALISLWGTADVLRYGVWQEEAGHGGVGSLSAYFAAIAPLFAVAFAVSESRKARWLIGTVLVLILVAAVAGRQRMLLPIFLAQLAIGVALAHRAGLLRLSRRALWIGFAGALIFVAVTVPLLQAWRTHTHQVTPIAQDSRWAAWPKVVDRILDQPLVGAGLGRQAMRRAHPDLVVADVSHAHNVFLNAGISMGLPGVLAMLWLFAALLLAYARLLNAAEARTRWIGIAGILMITGVLARNLTNDFFVRDGALLFWALNGALLGAGLRAALATTSALTANVPQGSLPAAHPGSAHEESSLPPPAGEGQGGGRA